MRITKGAGWHTEPARTEYTITVTWPGRDPAPCYNGTIYLTRAEAARDMRRYLDMKRNRGDTLTTAEVVGFRRPARRSYHLGTVRF